MSPKLNKSNVEGNALGPDGPRGMKFTEQSEGCVLNRELSADLR